jgi:hypothetical protein
MGVRQKIVVMSLGDVAGVALDVDDDEFTGVYADVDLLPDVFVRDAMSPNSGGLCTGILQRVR